VSAPRRAALAAAGFAGLVLGAVALDRLFPLPLDRYLDRSPLVVARDGSWLRAFPAQDGRWRLATRPDQLPALFLDLLVAAEDGRFFVHPGVDPVALGRASLQLLMRGQVVSGGSTLAMQVAKLLDPRPRTLAAKALEILRALQLTWHHGRAEVLAMWLTLAPFGGDLEGVRAAALAWFGKEPGSLAPAEMALLVTLPRAPEQLRPDRHPRAARSARDSLIRRLLVQGALDADTAAAAVAMPVPTVRRPLPMRAPHLAERLRADVPGHGGNIATTLDPDLQAGLERVMQAAVAGLPAPVSAAAVLVEHASGTVRAWAGSPDYLDRRRHGMVDHARAVRSPGSTLKPFVYGLAFDRFLAHPASIVRDEPRQFADYAPDNFDDGFSGEVTVAQALQRSLNLPAVTVLQRLGPVGFVQALGDAGLDLRLGEGRQPGLPVVLGGVGVTLLDLVAGYGAIAGDGRVRALRLLQDTPEDPGRQLLSPAAAAALRTILAGVPTPMGARPARVLAYKTGTSFRYKDGWAIGFDGRYVAGVWVGRSDAGSCGRACTGYGGAAPILARIFDLVAPTPLRPAPAASPFAGGAPPVLARLDGGLGPLDGGPAVEFPADAALLDVAPGTAVPLRARGGQLPYRWYVDGRPLPEAPARRRQAAWRDPAPGWAEITVVDAQGRTGRTRVRVMAPGSGQAVLAGVQLPGGAEHGIPERVPGQKAFQGIVLGDRQDQEGEARQR
jgi:penicillin-binding protein 1C